MPELTEEERTRLQSAASQLNSYELQAEALRQQLSSLTRTLSEHSVTLETLRAIKGLQPDTETLVSIGSGCHVFAKLKADGRVLYGVGAGVMLEKSTDEAISLLEGRMKELQDAMEKTRAELEKVTADAEKLRPELEKLLEKARG